MIGCADFWNETPKKEISFRNKEAMAAGLSPGLLSTLEMKAIWLHPVKANQFQQRDKPKELCKF